jgi:Tfp pilus assembly protein PilO
MTFVRIHKKCLKTAGLIWSACIIAFLFVYIFVLGPQRDYKRSIENKLAEKQKAYESALRAARKETKIELNKQIAHLRSRLKDFVIDFDDSANLTFDISQIASEKQVASFSIKSRDGRGLSTIPDCKYICENQINISFTGGFNQFAEFLNALERHRPVLFINKFTIIRLREDDSGYHVSLNVAALVRKQQDDKRSAKVYSSEI